MINKLLVDIGMDIIKKFSRGKCLGENEANTMNIPYLPIKSVSLA